MQVPHSSPKIEDIAIPETVEVAIMQWWNSPACVDWRDCVCEEAAEHLELAVGAVKVALLSLRTNPVVPSSELCDKMRHLFVVVTTTDNADCIAVAKCLQEGLFLRQAPEVPEEIKALMWVSDPDLSGTIAQRHDEDVRAAFKAGLEARDAAL